MPIRPLNTDNMQPTTIAVYDLMSDGRWYDTETLLTHGAAVCAEVERAEALKNGRRVRRKTIAKGIEVPEAELITSGARDIVRNRLMISVRNGRFERDGQRHRMLPDTCSTWQTVRPGIAAPTLPLAPAAPKPDTSAAAPACPAPAPVAAAETESTGKKRKRETPLVWGGIPEAAGFAAAPLALRSRVHFRTGYMAVPLDEFRAALPAGTEVTFDEGEGLYRVECAHGTGEQIRDFIRDWCEEREIDTTHLRPEKDVRRRAVRDLDPQFLSDLCLYYAHYANGRLRRHQSTLQVHFDDLDDQKQQVFEWVLDAASRYDETSGVPFGAFLSNRLSKWVHDLSRNKYGRTLTDAEAKQHHAIQRFMAEKHRQPTEAELAEAMGQPLQTFRKNARTVATLQSLRNVKALDFTEGEMEVQVADASFADDQILGEEKATLVSHLLTSACTVDEGARGHAGDKPNVLGWVMWLEQGWGSKTKTDLAEELGTSMRNLNVHGKRVKARMTSRATEVAEWATA